MTTVVLCQCACSYENPPAVFLETFANSNTIWRTQAYCFGCSIEGWNVANIFGDGDDWYNKLTPIENFAKLK